MTDGTDPSNWDEVTIKKPGMRATPAEVNDFLRGLLPEDVILPYQQRIAEGGMREAVGDLRQALAILIDRRGGIPKDVIQLFSGLLDMLDPDHEGFNGMYPSKLLCPHHEGNTHPPHRQMNPPMRPCSGYPYCKAGIRVRETRR